MSSLALRAGGNSVEENEATGAILHTAAHNTMIYKVNSENQL